MRHLGNAINKMLYIGTQITEKIYSKSSHIIARQLRSLNKKESHNSYALSNYEFKYFTILVVLSLTIIKYEDYLVWRVKKLICLIRFFK